MPKNELTIIAVNPTTGNQITKYLYEDTYNASLQTSSIYPDSSDTNSNGTDQIKNTYYLDGNVKTQTDQNGSVRTFSYDVYRRPITDAVTTLGNNVVGTVRKIARNYTTHGALEKISSIDSTNAILNEVKYEYDTNLKLKKLYQSDSGSVTTSTPYLEYLYDSAHDNRLSGVVYPSGKLLTYNYNTFDNITLINENTTPLVSYIYDGSGSPMQTTYNQPNVSLTYVNGGLDRYARIINHSWIKNTNPLVHIIHSYDYNGNRIKRYDPIHAVNSELYTYDNLGQIKTLNRGVLNTAQNTVTTVNHSESWNFDKTGNWSQYTKNSVTKNRDHNAANELQGIANHDANGNMVLMPGLKGKYDAWNRLVEVRDSNDNLIAQYEYNGLNQRLKKTVGSTVTKSFFNENWQEIESVTNNQVTSYVWGLRYIDDLVLREKGEERLYSLADPNWNVIAICDSTGSVVERMKYDAFGKITRLNNNFGTKNGSDYAWNRTFTGQVFDLETELMLYRNRYYHTGLGRFTTIDPIKYEAGDENLYRYCENIPVQSWDSYGYSRNGKRNKAPSVHCSLDPCVKVCNGNRLPGQLDKTACIEKCFQMEAAFQDWYERNRDITWTKNLEPCPCNLKDRCKNKDKWTEPTTELHGYHVGATSCIRSSTGIWKSENQCCYDENGNLITSGSGQGSADRWRGPSITFPGHVVYDMEPADWATLLDGGRWGCHSEAYLNVRPQVKPDDCEGVPTPVQ